MSNHQAFTRSLHVAGEALQRAARALDAASQEPANNNNNNNNPQQQSQHHKRPVQLRDSAPSGFRDDLLTGRQLGAIHAVARKAGVSRDGLAELVRSFGREQVTELSRAEASELIDRLQAANTR